MTSSLDRRQARRAVALGLACGILALAGCQSRAPLRPLPGQVAEQPPGTRHSVAVIVPLTGPDGPVGTSIGNAARLALLDTASRTIELKVYDSTQGGAAAVAARAIAEGNRLILGPLLAEDVRAAAPVARRARVPVIAFSNDESVAGDGVYILGFTPRQSIERVVGYARARGAQRFGALVPAGVYGQRAAEALTAAVRSSGGTPGAIETFSRTAAGARTAANALSGKGRLDAVLIADSGRLAAQAAAAIRPGPRLLGTELWANDSVIAATPRLRGAWFAAAPDVRFNQLVARYRARYGKVPYRLGSLGYDAVLLTVRAARGWPARRPFPQRLLTERDGFAGVDGIFRFGHGGVAERALEVREVTAAG
ncbi:MAG TPA: penicillin-binding protein activator, partial [Sphingomicrobium sp.]|nr:penicillin-binding protein activator [Sphingomicrobium sp.]